MGINFPIGERPAQVLMFTFTCFLWLVQQRHCCLNMVISTFFPACIETLSGKANGYVFLPNYPLGTWAGDPDPTSTSAQHPRVWFQKLSCIHMR